MNESTLVPREEMSDLDWLARNVHEWSLLAISCDVRAIDNQSNRAGRYAVFHIIDCSGTFKKTEWLARRAELQNKPSWDEAPEWAEWLAQDANGSWYFYPDGTRLNSGNQPGMWSHYAEDRWAKFATNGEVLGDWRDTLEKRPEQKSFEPFVSAEDAATAKQPAPKGSGNPILGMVLADLTNRALEGKEKYGEPLLAHNGRNPLWDAYQEALDLAMYLRQAIEEQK